MFTIGKMLLQTLPTASWMLLLFAGDCSPGTAELWFRLTYFLLEWILSIIYPRFIETTEFGCIQRADSSLEKAEQEAVGVVSLC